MLEVGNRTSYAGLPLKSMAALCELLDRQPNVQTIQTLVGVAERLLQGECLELIPIGTLAHALRQLEDCLTATACSSESIAEVQQRMRHLVVGDRPPVREYRPVSTSLEHVLWLPDIEASFARENSVHGGDWAGTKANLAAASRTHALMPSKEQQLRYRSAFANAAQVHGTAAPGTEDCEFIDIPDLGITSRRPSVRPGRGPSEPPHQPMLEPSGSTSGDDDFPDTQAFNDCDEVPNENRPA